MKSPSLNNGVSRLVIVVALAGAALSGCNNPALTPTAPQDVAQAPQPIAALALSTAQAPPLAPAPAANALPPAPRPRWSRLANPADSYAYADQAYGLNQAFGDAPPDYTFDYNGVRPWVWRSDSDDMRVVEPLDGGDRYYYYQPGADAPYLVRDPDYSYAYQDGVLVAVYDRSGRQLDDEAAEQRLDLAGRYLARARAIYAASRQQQHQAVAQANWIARRQAEQDERARWAQDQRDQADWRAYHAQHDSDQQAQWAAERYRREAEAARFALAINDVAAAQHDQQAAREAQARVAPQGAPQGGGGGQRGPAPQPGPNSPAPAATYGPKQGPAPSAPYGRQSQATPQQPARNPSYLERGQQGAGPTQTTPPSPPQPPAGQPPRDRRAGPPAPAVIAPGQDQAARQADARGLAMQQRQAAEAQRAQAAQQAQSVRQAQALAAQQQAQARIAAAANARAAAASASAAEAGRQRAALQAQTAERARVIQQQVQAKPAAVAPTRPAMGTAPVRAIAPPPPLVPHPPEKPKHEPRAPGQPPAN